MTVWGNNYGIEGFVPPVDNARITSTEGYRKPFRTTNGKMSSSQHRGVDVVSTKGGKVPIKNSFAGEVVRAGVLGGYGNVVTVRSPNGVLTQYAHLDKIDVKVGDVLQAGQQLGIMGATGNSKGVHLDMIVMKDGVVINRDGKPVGYQPTRDMQSLAKATTTATPSAVAPTPPTTPASVPEPTAPQFTATPAPTSDNFFTSPKPSTTGGDYDILGHNLFGSENFTNPALAAVKKAVEIVQNGGSLFQSHPLDNGVSRLFDSLEMVENNGYPSSTIS